MKKTFTNIVCFVVLFIFCSGAACSFADSQVQPSKVEEAGELQWKTEPYNGQNSIECDGMKVSIPQFYPSAYEDLFLRFSDRQCGENYFEMFVGIGADCSGTQVCYDTFFSKQKIDSGYVRSALYEVIDQNLKEVKLDKNKTGYIIPIRVYAFPTPSRIIWTDQEYIYVIGNKGGDEANLVKSANSLINAN